MSKTLKAALWYAEHGFSVLPAYPPREKDGKDEGKRPRVSTWEEWQKKKATAKEINEWWHNWPDSRVGLVTGAISDLTVIDCDTPDAMQIVEDLLPDNLIVPKETSPRGGVHYFFKHEPEIPTRANIVPSLDARSEGGFILCHPSSGLNGKCYAWMRDLHIANIALVSVPHALKEYIVNSINRGGMGGILIPNAILNQKTSVTSNIVNQNTSIISNEVNKKIDYGQRDEVLFHIANSLFKGKMPIEEIKALLTLIAQNCCDPPFPEKEVSAKIKSVLDRADRQARNISQEVREWALINSGQFFINDCIRESNLINSKDKHIASVTFNNMVRDGILERVGNKRGCYRRVEKETEEIKWWEANCQEIPLWLPLDLQEYVKVLPKTITVIAGSQDAGKTALLLNLAYKNAATMPTKYFSSEMDANELALRLACLDYRDEKQLRMVQFRDRSSMFADVIEPDGLNIIDYFEITDNFYRIAEEFRQIRDKLNKGVAIIALQKDAKKELGRGGSFSMEKPRLYLTVDREAGKGNILRVQKAKNWRNTETNPNGFARNFWIFQGINLKAKDVWGPEC